MSDGDFVAEPEPKRRRTPEQRRRRHSSSDAEGRSPQRLRLKKEDKLAMNSRREDAKADAPRKRVSSMERDRSGGSSKGRGKKFIWMLYESHIKNLREESKRAQIARQIQAATTLLIRQNNLRNERNHRRGDVVKIPPVMRSLEVPAKRRNVITLNEAKKIEGKIEMKEIDDEEILHAEGMILPHGHQEKNESIRVQGRNHHVTEGDDLLV
ncbi:hypothetical protein TELCIR_05343 [Teladorsagia circumcincta]|uniref:Uncharacterized protein n=1 Tax=Teladorsagia circumcincta TaxID=45464 RepID=A0A2G9URD1_TELCI|nr:hypothetical protein TELCIR_05343 [Teladorsagia circumcincta]